MNNAKKLLTAKELRRERRTAFVVELVGWVTLAVGGAIMALVWYTFAVVVLGGDL
jgi:hypothetical protein|tara:strand:+ start:72 stop:236 length:165 start_codon:yes stop_codon:yes gene_type:complete